jgi:mRNA-degrading endonuclease RelE of RelBE toxin-antitoxin system
VFKSRRSKQFRALLEALPVDAQRQAYEAYQLFKENPRHGSLQFKLIGSKKSSIYSARVGDHYRVIGKLIGDTVYWEWIGSHEEYNKLV